MFKKTTTLLFLLFVIYSANAQRTLDVITNTDTLYVDTADVAKNGAVYTYLWWYGDSGFDFSMSDTSEHLYHNVTEEKTGWSSTYNSRRYESYLITTENYGSTGNPDLASIVIDPQEHGASSSLPKCLDPNDPNEFLRIQNFRKAVPDDTCYLIVTYGRPKADKSTFSYLELAIDFGEDQDNFEYINNSDWNKSFLPHRESFLRSDATGFYWALNSGHLDRGQERSILLPFKYTGEKISDSLVYDVEINRSNPRESIQVETIERNHQMDFAKSHDPNQVQILRENTGCAIGGERLEQTVRFENTGEGQTEYVKIIVQMDEAHDLSTIDVTKLPRWFDTIIERDLFGYQALGSVGMEASYKINEANKTVTFEFMHLQLTGLGDMLVNDSNRRKDFIKFKVKVKDDWIMGNTIRTQARIIFDENRAVITNEEIVTCENPEPVICEECKDQDDCSLAGINYKYWFLFCIALIAILLSLLIKCCFRNRKWGICERIKPLFKRTITDIKKSRNRNVKLLVLLFLTINTASAQRDLMLSAGDRVYVDRCDVANSPVQYDYLWWFGDGRYDFTTIDETKHVYKEFGSVRNKFRSSLITTENYGSTGNPDLIFLDNVIPQITSSNLPKYLPSSDYIQVDNFRKAVKNDTFYLIVTFSRHNDNFVILNKLNLNIDFGGRQADFEYIEDQANDKSFLPYDELYDRATQSWDLNKTELKKGEERSILLPFKYTGEEYKDSMDCSIRLTSEYIDSSQVSSSNTIVLSHQIDFAESHDPNQAQVSKEKTSCLIGGEELEYTVRFENTGQAATEYVRIEMQMDRAHDLSNFDMITFPRTFNAFRAGPINNSMLRTNNRQARLEIDKINNKIIFEFHYLYLMGLEDKTFGNGNKRRDFIKFKVKVKDGYVIGTPIRARAKIFFDRNHFVETNEVVTTCDNPMDSEEDDPCEKRKNKIRGTNCCFWTSFSFILIIVLQIITNVIFYRRLKE